MKYVTVTLAALIISTNAAAFDKQVHTIGECESIQSLSANIMAVRQSGDPRHVADELLDLRIFQNAAYHGDRKEWIDAMAKSMVDYSYEYPIEAVNGTHARIIGRSHGAAFFKQCIELLKEE